MCAETEYDTCAAQRTSVQFYQPMVEVKRVIEIMAKLFAAYRWRDLKRGSLSVFLCTIRTDENLDSFQHAENALRLVTAGLLGLKEYEGCLTPQTRQQTLRKVRLLSFLSEGNHDIVQSRWGVIEESREDEDCDEH